MMENSIRPADVFCMHKKLAIDADSSVHIKCGNEFTQNIMPYIISTIYPINIEVKNTRNTTPEEKSIDVIKTNIILSNINQEKPTKRAQRSSKTSPIYPTEAINNNITYASDVKVDVNIFTTVVHMDGKEVKSESKINQLTLIAMPVMVGSDTCNTHGLSNDILENLGEDITDQGGYFIIKGGEYIINFLESNVYNLERIYNNVGFMNEKTRVELYSKKGDGPENSYQSFIKLLNNGQIIVTIDRAPLKNIQFPFFLLFRLLGWESDKQIVDWIVYGNKQSSLSKQLIVFLSKAYEMEYKEYPDAVKMNREDILKNLCYKITETYTNKVDFADEKTRIYYERKIMDSIDEYFIPHCGSTFNFRTDKAIVLALIIRKMLLTTLNIIPQTDRDSHANKRIHTSAHCLAKAFKQHITNVIRRIILQVTKDCSTTPFHKLDITQSIKNSIDIQSFLRTMCQAITVGTKQELKTAGNMVMINRLVSQLITPKNQAFVKALMLQVNRPGAESSRQTTRGVDMRKTHPSALGILDSIQQPDGPQVGLNNGLTILTRITSSSSSQVLIDILKQDTDIIPLLGNSFMLMETHAVVYVNKIPIGLCKYKNKYMFDKYRTLRSQKLIHHHTSITWNPVMGDLEFWVDNGRAYRPMLIVYNNYGNAYTRKNILSKRFPEQKDPELYVRKTYPKMEDFKQWTLLTKQHINDLIAGKITIDNLVEENIMEYVTGMEVENLLLSVNYEKLTENFANPLLRYDYCDEPISWFSVLTLGVPFASYSPTVRNSLGVLQSKQACGWFSFNFNNKIVKSGYFQRECQTPITSTIITEFTPPNGMNVKVAIMINSGMNTEDGLVVNSDAVDLGLLRVYNFKYILETLDRGYQFGMPDPTNTKDIRPNVSYEKLVNGFPKKGTIINYDDVIIGKQFKLPTVEGNYIFSDCSKIYKYKVPGIVNKVFVGRDEDGKTFVKVQLIVIKNTKSGDKFSMRCGQKGICSIVKGIDMPYDSNGESPSFMFNPHSLPSRMTINACIELLFGKVCLENGDIGDATIFNKIDIEYLQNELKRHGLSSDGKDRLYDGKTGRWIDCKIYTGPIFYQRLQKFPDEQLHIVNKCSTDIVTRQPLKGKSSNGGLRIGEMEKDIILSNGMARVLNEKFTNHSDGCKAHICCNCGNYAIVNTDKKIYKCYTCDDLAVITEIDTTWTSKIFFDYLRCMNIKTEFELEKYNFYN